MSQVAGKYADDMFEDIGMHSCSVLFDHFGAQWFFLGHSNEARKELKNYLVGPLEVQHGFATLCTLHSRSQATEQEIAALSASSSASGAASGGALVRTLSFAPPLTSCCSSALWWLLRPLESGSTSILKVKRLRLAGRSECGTTTGMRTVR